MTTLRTSRILMGMMAILFLPIFALAQLSIPEHKGIWVHDDANMLSAGMKNYLEKILKAERDSTTNQIAVLVIPSLDGEALEDYTLRVAEAWKLGKKDTDNGVLFLVAVRERKVRIEVGQGLEGRLTDAMSNRIIRNEITPFFRQGNYDGGVQAGVESIIKVIQGEYKNTEPIIGRKKSKSPWTTLIFIIVILIIAASRRGGGGLGGMWVIGSMLGSGMGRDSGSWGGGGDYGGGGSFGGGGSSGSW